VEAAEAYYVAHRTALAYGVGPRLIHGDLHLANVIVDGGRVSGLVDWEWAGGGEPDVDLAHLVRWAWFPAHPAEEALGPLVGAEQYLPLIPALLEAYAEIGSLPRLWERLTIYEIEYDLHQLTHSPCSTQAHERLRAWLHARVLQTGTGDFSPSTR
ncbi:MAG TPA: phosphotransferase, partial [Chloroflexota bacterium]|nr:phosphotransferase [Chloroflexota bacterium]